MDGNFDTGPEPSADGKSERGGNVPSLADLVRDFIAQSAVKGGHSEDIFRASCNQAEIMWTAYEVRGLRGKKSATSNGTSFGDFCKACGNISYDTGMKLVTFHDLVDMIYPQVAAEAKRIGDAYEWPSWKSLYTKYRPKPAPKPIAEPGESPEVETPVDDDLAAKLFASESARKAAESREIDLAGLLARQAKRIEALQGEIASEQNAIDEMSVWTVEQFTAWRDGSVPEASVEASTDPVGDDSGTADDSRQRGFEAATEAMAKATGGTVYEAGKAKADKARSRSKATPFQAKILEALPDDGTTATLFEIKRVMGNREEYTATQGDGRHNALRGNKVPAALEALRTLGLAECGTGLQADSWRKVEK